MPDAPEPAFHREVAEALIAIGDPRYGLAVQLDRGSQLPHLGITFPDLRARVMAGFSFYALAPESVLQVWDGLWHGSPYGDVLYAALEYYLWKSRTTPDAALWPTVRRWAGRVDNWCHADLLSNLYSRLLEHDHDAVYPQLQQWNAAESEWLRRISLVSLVHYTGKNAVFLPPDDMFPLVDNCLDDHRKDVATAAGWVLREMDRAHPAETSAFLERHAHRMSAPALTRATERRPPEERTRLRALRVQPATRFSPSPHEVGEGAGG
jgi:3-methyladenine DNA glycosylase AlkD